MSRIVEFKKELRELLSKYDASLRVLYDDCSDMHGVYGEHMAVELDGRSHFLCDHWGIDVSDLN